METLLIVGKAILVTLGLFAGFLVLKMIVSYFEAKEATKDFNNARGDSYNWEHGSGNDYYD